MPSPTRHRMIDAERRRMAEHAAALGVVPGAPRTRLRDPDKAALLRAAGVPEEQIGPVGERSDLSRRR